MKKESFSDKPRHATFDWCTFQIGQCRLHVHLTRTKEFYALLPKITENCTCDGCKIFENEVIKQENRLFEILNEMKVDLSRQPNINPDGICCVGQTKPGKIGYMGNYFVYGQIGKTTKDSKQVNEENIVTEVNFNDTEFGKNTHVTVKQFEPDKLSFEFYMDVDSNSKNDIIT